MVPRWRSQSNSRGQLRRLPVLCAAFAGVALAACGVSNLRGGLVPRGLGSAPSSVSPSGQAHPNIVFVLTDDLSVDLLRFMPHVRAMQSSGATFANYFVTDSLCCPSRASIFTGEFPHNTGVLTNAGRYGGFQAFHRRGLERGTFAVALQRSGYLTAMMGKYLNGYLPAKTGRVDGSPARVPLTYVPPGWNEWDVGGWGYAEFNYRLNESGVIHRYGHRPRDYLTDVLARKGVDFVRRAAQSHHPFFLELSTFAPHAPYVPAPRNRHDFPWLTAPRPPSFDLLPSHSPEWLATHQRLTRQQTDEIDSVFRRRARSVEAIDQMVGRIEGALRSSGVSGDTYIFFSSDNGLHAGQYRLMPGKGTAFDTDIKVPLIVTGPGVPAGKLITKLAENIDLAETFTAIGGSPIPGDGHSLLALLHGKRSLGWRDAILVENHTPPPGSRDPDAQPLASGRPMTYHAMRTRDFLYVEYSDGEIEFYDLRRDPLELHNTAAQLTRRQRTRLHRELTALRHCHGPVRCWRAMHLPA
jgi:N-acetylglucosamine-6-sulfatase